MLQPSVGVLAARIQEDNVLSLSSFAAPAADDGASMKTAPQPASADRTLATVLASLSDDKAEDIVQIDLRGKSEMGDYMVIASGRSTRQVSAMSEKLTDRLKHEFGILSKVEGKDSGDWVLIDTGDVIVHIFRPEVRDFYQLEKMWLSPGEDGAVKSG
ncbi:ribosome silencing factor [Salibaculum griseiflavum]